MLNKQLPQLTLVLTGALVVSASTQAATVATAFNSSDLITTTGQTLDGFTVALDTLPGNLVTDGDQTVTNSTLTGLINEDNNFTISRVRFNPSGNTATWDITNAAAPGTKLYFAVIDVDGGTESSTVTDGVDGIDASLLLTTTGAQAYEFNSNDVYASITYNDTTGVLSALAAGNEAPIVLWDVSALSTVTWTPSNNSQQATFITVVPEPGSLALLGLGGLCVLRRRRKS